MYKKNLILGRSRFTTRKKIPTCLQIITYFSKVTYILGFWELKRALNVVSVCIFDDLRYLFENACCQVVRMDVIINMHNIFVHSKRQVQWYSRFPIKLISPVKEIFQWMNIEMSSVLVSSDSQSLLVILLLKTSHVLGQKTAIKAGIMALYPEGIAILQDYIATIHRSRVKLLKQFS